MNQLNQKEVPQQKLINTKSQFRPEIEGLRVVAALLVAVYHIWFNRVSGGVDVFFVISGFLITTSIISTINRTGEFRFLPYVTKLIKRVTAVGPVHFSHRPRSQFIFTAAIDFRENDS